MRRPDGCPRADYTADEYLDGVPYAARTAPRPRALLPRAIAAVTLILLALVLTAPAAAQAGSERVALPALRAGQSVDDAVRTLRRLGLRGAVVRADGYPTARGGHHFVAVGWAVERRVSRRTSGARRGASRVRYITIKPGSRHRAGTLILVRPRQVPFPPVTPVAGRGPAAPAPAPAATEPAPPAVNAGGTPVMSEPLPGPAPGIPVAPAATSAEVGPVPPPPSSSVPPAPEPVVPPVDLAAETARFLRDTTVHLPFMDGCTGFLLRDARGGPIGAVSAAHCGLLPERTPRVTGGNGGLYAVVPGPLAVRSGDVLDSSMRTVGTAQTVTLAPTTDRTHDVALISFTGIAPAQVRAAYEAIRLAPAEVAGLAPGRTVTLSAFPNVQPRNSSVPRRQVMIASVLGRAPIYTSSQRTIPTVWTAMRANADGAVCSYGASGGAAVMSSITSGADGTPVPTFRVLGVLAGFDDFRPAGTNTAGYDGPRVRLEREAQTGFDLFGVDTTCDYAYELPDASTAETVRLVTSSTQIPR